MKPGSLNTRLPKHGFKLDFGTMKIQSIFVTCQYDGCASNPEYITKTGNIRSGTVAGFIGVEDQMRIYYCRDCLPKLMTDLRKELDVTLWAFK
jgi:hypothetical protein